MATQQTATAATAAAAAALVDRVETNYPKNRIRVLLLEGIHDKARDVFERETFQVEMLKSSLSREELIEKLKNVHLLGIRSKTQVPAEVLRAARKLKAVGCFCIGTDTVDLDAAEKLGIPVFNSPFLNTRSVAELVMAEIVFLSRRAGDRSMEMHGGRWNKSAAGCHEVRGLTLGIVGYGHVGSQVSLLAEAFGMRVVFYDIVTKLPLGNAQSVDTFDQLLAMSDVVTIHVPKTDQTRNMLGKDQIELMRPGALLLNLARGEVIDVEAVAAALRSGRLGGCAVDVFPQEPEEAATNSFVTPLQKCPNTILTPHIGGSTIEAQREIGVDVARKLTSYINTGSTDGAVNFPQILPPLAPGKHRLLHIHPNKPGMLKSINNILSDYTYNVSGQVLATSKNIGYLLVDLDSEVSKEIMDKIKENVADTIKSRLLY